MELTLKSVFIYRTSLWNVRTSTKILAEKFNVYKGAYMKDQYSKIKELINYIQDNRFKLSLIIMLLGILLLSIILKNQPTTSISDLLVEESVTMDTSEESILEATMTSPPEKTVITEEQNDSLQEIYVDVKGAVNEPNMYAFPAGSRVYDAIEAAGGFTVEAASETVNQALLLKDQMLIYINTHEELESMNFNENETENFVDHRFQTVETDTGSQSQLININSATEVELMALPNIGPKKAEAIVKYRQDHGSFSIIEDIMSVSGIGEKTFENLKEYISVGP